jgi:Permuted papain-like amidase enzyme, YaeF/YiiX, C92 family/Protein of unknown function (DUF3616)
MKYPALSRHGIAALLFLIAVTLRASAPHPDAPATPVANAPGSEDLRDGDVVFQDSHSEQSEYVKKATKSEYSHCGIYFTSPQGGVVYEAIGKNSLEPTSWSDWKKRGLGAYKVRRISRTLSADELSILRSASAALNNSKYDWLFEWSPDAIYCSELVWKAYDAIHVDLGGSETLAPYYQGEAKAILDARFKKVDRQPRPEEKIVAPQRLFESPALASVPLAAANEAPAIVPGTIQLPEISGALAVGNRLLVTADDVEDKNDMVKKYHMLVLLDKAITRLKGPTLITPTDGEQIYRPLLEKLGGSSSSEHDAELITDLEDITASPQGDIYLISSHSLSKKNDLPPKRQRLLRVRINAETGGIKEAQLNQRSIIEALPKELADSTKLRPGEKKDEKYTPGFNIEGLAWASPNNLLLGLRSPLVESPAGKVNPKAIVLRLDNLNSAFDPPNDPSAPIKITIEAKLDLGGMGIRGMCYDDQKKGYWMLAGISPDPDEPDSKLPNDWSLWFWDGKDVLQKKFERAHLPSGVRLENPEAVCLVGAATTERSVLLISDDGAKTPSSYALIPIDRLK